MSQKVIPLQKQSSNDTMGQNKKEKIFKRHKKLMKFAYTNCLTNSSIQVNPLKSIKSLQQIHAKPLPNINIQEFDNIEDNYDNINCYNQNDQDKVSTNNNQNQQLNIQQNNKNLQHFSLNIINKKVLKHQNKKEQQYQSPLKRQVQKRFSPHISLKKAKNLRQPKLLQNQNDIDNLSTASTSHQLFSSQNNLNNNNQLMHFQNFDKSPIRKTSTTSILSHKSSYNSLQNTPSVINTQQDEEDENGVENQQENQINQSQNQQTFAVKLNNLESFDTPSFCVSQKGKHIFQQEPQQIQDLSIHTQNEQQQQQQQQQNTIINDNNKCIVNVQSNLDENEEIFCRICKDDEILEPLISPCSCQGSVKYVHHSCLHQWVSQNINEKNGVPQQKHFICEICQQKYSVIESYYCSLIDALKNQHEKSSVKCSLFCIIFFTLIMGFLGYIISQQVKQYNFLTDVFILICFLEFLSFCIVIGNFITLLGSMQQFKWQFTNKHKSTCNQLTLPKILQIQKDISINKIYTKKENQIEKLQIDQTQQQQFIVNTDCFEST